MDETMLALAARRGLTRRRRRKVDPPRRRRKVSLTASVALNPGDITETVTQSIVLGVTIPLGHSPLATGRYRR